MSAAGSLAPPGTLRRLARPAPAPRLEAAVGPGLLRRRPMPPRRVGLCQPRVPRGPGTRLWPQGEERSGSPRAVRFPELWDVHPGLGSNTCSLLGGCGGAGPPSSWKGDSDRAPPPSLRRRWWASGPRICRLDLGACRLAGLVKPPPELAQMNGQ